MRVKAAGMTSIAVGLAALVAAAEGRAGETAARPSPESEPPIVALGRRLFQDPTVSRSASRSCASCHDPEHGWSDARKLSADADGPTRRHSQPVADLGGDGFHWDGEFAKALDVVAARLGDADEQRRASFERFHRRQTAAKAAGKPTNFRMGYGFGPGEPGDAPVAQRLALDARYGPAFLAAFGDPVPTTQRVVDAVDAFIGSLRTGENALDRFLAGDDGALTPSARRGLELFRGRAACATCHRIDASADGRAALTDRRYHDTGIAFVGRPADALVDPRKAEVPSRVDATVRFIDGIFDGSDDGRGEQTSVDAEIGAFKTPSLRDVARRGPYMHDGSLATLADVVRYYAKGGTPNAHLDAEIKPFALSESESADLVAFLESLSGAARAGALAPHSQPKSLRVTVLDVAGAPMPGLVVEAVPFGERFGDDASSSTFVSTKDDGTAVFAFPQTTHVLLRAEGMKLASGRPIPDCASEIVVTAAPTDRVFVRLIGKDLPERLAGTVRVGRPRGLFRLSRDVVVHVKLPNELEAKVEGAKEESLSFERMGPPTDGGALYCAKPGAVRTTEFVQFHPAEGDALAAAIDLSGGLSDPATLRTIRVVEMPNRSAPIVPAAPK
jgi:cytochrome c peroxidase